MKENTQVLSLVITIGFTLDSYCFLEVFDLRFVLWLEASKAYF